MPTTNSLKPAREDYDYSQSIWVSSKQNNQDDDFATLEKDFKKEMKEVENAYKDSSKTLEKLEKLYKREALTLARRANRLYNKCGSEEICYQIAYDLSVEAEATWKYGDQAIIASQAVSEVAECIDVSTEQALEENWLLEASAGQAYDFKADQSELRIPFYSEEPLDNVASAKLFINNTCEEITANAIIRRTFENTPTE